MTLDFSVIAIIAAYNEEDIIGQVVAHLVDEGVNVYVLDHGSTDDTVAELKPYLGRGLLEIETFPDPADATHGAAGQFAWESILRRKEALARELDASWFIHHDADEFRESPWAHLGLRDAIQKVDALGYNAIDFELFNFLPTHDRFRRGDDVRQAFRFYEPGRSWDKLQVKCWKKLAPIDLVSTGGHDVAFEGRRIFPLRFILRHYPIRGQAHGERKVFRERRPRFVEAERARGWHVQYDAIGESHRFIRDPGTLIAFDPDSARLQLCLEHRVVEELRRKLAAQEQAAEAAELSVEDLRRDVEERQQRLEERDGQIGELRGQLEEIADLRRDVEARDRAIEDLRRDVEARDRAIEDLRRDVEARDRAIEDLRRDVEARDRAIEDLRRQAEARERLTYELAQKLASAGHEIESLTGDLSDARHRVDALYASRSWRWMAPLRAAQRLFFRE